MIQPEFFKKITDTYSVANRNAITDTTLLQTSRDFEETIGHKITAINPEAIATRFSTDASVLITTKYDGQGIHIYFEASDNPAPHKPEIFAYHPYSGRAYTGLPSLLNLATQLKQKGVKKALLRAELYIPGEPNAKRPNNADIARVAFNGTPSEINSMSLAIIRILMLDGQNWITKPIIENFEKMGELLGAGKTGGFHRIHGRIIPEKDILASFEATTSAGLEGCVIFRLNRHEAFKIKPKISIDAVIIGYVESESEGKHLVRSLLTALTYKETGHNTHFQVFNRVFSKMDDTTAEKLLPILQSKRTSPPVNTAGSPFLMTDSENRPITFIKPEIIIQVQGDEIITSKNDTPNTSQLMSYQNGQWTFLKILPCPRLSFPTYDGIREDKTIESGGARIQQVNPEAVLNFDIQTETDPTMELRKVWIKTANNETSVRKLVVINNGNSTQKLPYSILFTDFSPTRATAPLQTKAQFAKTPARKTQLVDAILTDVKRGWTEVPAQG